MDRKRKHCRVISIGYEGRSLDDFLHVLETRQVTTLLDVRELPLSRRKGFSKTALEDSLREKGIGYAHLKFAGNPYRNLRESDLRSCLRKYTARLRRNADLVEMAADCFSDGDCVAVLCHERDHDHCHRSVLLDAIHEAGHRISVVRVD